MKPVKLRNEVAVFAEDMERKLRENDHKGGWQAEGFRYLYTELREEVHEIWCAYLQEDGVPDYDEIIRECADASNYAMMIADWARRKKEAVNNVEVS